MAILVGRWDCSTCGNKAILGPKTQCPNCGASRPEDVRFYLPDDAEIVTIEEQLKEARAGVDWICGHCSTQNKAHQVACRGCGNPRDEQSEDVNLAEKTYELHEVPKDALIPYEPPARKPKRNTSGGWILALILVIVGFYFLSQIPKDIDVTVSGFTWERTLQMAHYEPVQKEEWHLPKEAYDVSKFRAIHHYDKVFRGYETRYRDVRVKVGEERYVCGQRDKGNGYFEEVYCTRPIYRTKQEAYDEAIYDNVPVYKDKYSFTVKEWVEKGAYLLRARGEDHHAAWPSQAYPDPANWREGERNGRYTALFKDDKGLVHEETFDFEKWDQFYKGQTLTATKSWLLGTYFGLKEP